MKVAVLISLFASASAFVPESTGSARTSVALDASRREAMAAAAGALLAPMAAGAAVGESPRFSVFGLIGDGGAYSEGAAYGSDQSTKVYSPYSVYGEQGEGSLYKPGNTEYADRKKKVLAESKVRLSKLSTYIDRKEWFNVKDELTRYMYETRGAVRGLSTSIKQKEAAEAFFLAIEETYTSATLKKQDKCAAAAAKSIEKLDAFVATL